MTPENVDNLTLLEPGRESIQSLETVTPPQKFIDEVKKDVKLRVISEENQDILQHVQTLVKQGHILALSKVEQTDAVWQSYIFNLPKGTMKWILNAAIDTLPTKTNLKQWGKLTNDKCFCSKRQTLAHILNGCKVSLNQGRFNLRHDSILSYIAQCLDRQRYTCYIDIPGFQTPAGGTLPADIIVTALRPDIVLVDNKKKNIAILELTCPGEQRIDAAHKLKQDKYDHFLSDIKTHKVSVHPFEVGSTTGHITRDNRNTLLTLHKWCKKEIKFKVFKKNVSAIAVLSSYFLFNCRNEPEWEGSAFITPPFSNQ